MSAEFYVIGTLGQPVQGRSATITGRFPTANRFGRIVRNEPFAVTVTLTDEAAAALQGKGAGTGVVARGRVIPRDDKPASGLLLASHVDVTGPQPTVHHGALAYGDWGHLGATLSAEVISDPQVHDFGRGALRVSFLASYNARGSSVMVVSEGICAGVHAGLKRGDRVNLTGIPAEDTTLDPLGRPLSTLSFVVGRQDQQGAQAHRERAAAPRGRREPRAGRSAAEPRTERPRQQRQSGNAPQQARSGPREAAAAPGGAPAPQGAEAPAQAPAAPTPDLSDAAFTLNEDVFAGISTGPEVGAAPRPQEA